MNKITALPVERDNYGYWTHPLYEQFCDGREVISPDEFNAWLEANGLEWKVSYLDDEEIDPDVDGCDISTWQPDPPAGNGWFVGSIHDTENGAVCIWLRNVQVKAAADLYALCWQSGEVVTYTPAPEKATIWLNNYSGTCVQEYVKLERLQEALSGYSPVIPRVYLADINTDHQH
ncbi:hypothetical protein DTU76_07150 [Salmonella enterica subsp. enterica serovar Urbana]|nr:hypothetical protein [Salmonella enterica]EBX6608232.1 hypothetical protein [Salmonella enterica subsp. enterica serovar Typhimurium]EBX8836515.1 hypothetical protein [Salmonella enterica subsp. enterica serovar Urbana]ECD4154001.1 hypothetical protein [Salmonella enterica subsp. enterica serovar Poona]EAS1935166.1 hypothetical protein [Salmonella enterica]